MDIRVCLLFNFSWHVYKKDQHGIPAPYFVLFHHRAPEKLKS